MLSEKFHEPRIDLMVYGGIEQATAYSVEHPSCYCQGKAESKTNEHELVQVWCGSDGVGDLGGSCDSN